MKSRLARLSASLVAVAALGAVGTASAQYRGGYGPEYDYAEVLSVDPIIDVVNRPVARDECWEQPVTYREPVRYHGRRDRTPALLAGIVGGVIGNQFGSGSGRDAATAAGAVLGYSMARDSQRRHGGYYSGGREYTSYEQRCATRTDYYRDEQVNGYDVTYRYNGRVYHTTTDYHPGDQIRVEVNVNPAR
jgi:uncharacterized protein YcfJ